VNRRRVQLMLEDPKTAPTKSGALLIEETGEYVRTPRPPLMWESSTSAAWERQTMEWSR
jgi:hypothetical protein